MQQPVEFSKQVFETFFHFLLRVPQTLRNFPFYDFQKANSQLSPLSQTRPQRALQYQYRTDAWDEPDFHFRVPVCHCGHDYPHV